MSTIFSHAQTANSPIRLIFDTDIGNDVDDVMALAMIHALQSRGECELLGVSITKDNQYAAPLVQAINTFYGRPEIPIAVVKDGPTKEDGKYCKQIIELRASKKTFLYPHDKQKEPYPEAASFLRKCLVAQPDKSVVIVQVGFSTNLARLLETKADFISSLTGKELVEKKVRFISAMLGEFTGRENFMEYNVVNDISSAQELVKNSPVEMFFSGFEIGSAIVISAKRLQSDLNYSPNHIVKDAYRFYRGLDGKQPLWDLTSVLYAVRSEREYFTRSPAGIVKIHDNGKTSFEPKIDGKHFLLKISSESIPTIRETLSLLVSQPQQFKF
jgi:inosine-uridine nucleoside N-ribohydrolase